MLNSEGQKRRGNRPAGELFVGSVQTGALERVLALKFFIQGVVAALEQRDQPVQAVGGGGGLEQLLAHGYGGVQVGGDGVGKLHRVRWYLHLGRVATAERYQVPHEAGEFLGDLRGNAGEIIPDGLVKEPHKGGDVGLLLGNLDDLEAALALGHDVYAPLLQHLGAQHSRGGADGLRIGGLADFLPRTDQRDAEGRVVSHAVADHCLVALFEDMQWQRHTGKEHQVERKQGYFDYFIVLAYHNRASIAQLSRRVDTLLQAFA